MLSFILILIAGVFFTGIIIRTKSIASGRKRAGNPAANQGCDPAFQKRSRLQPHYQFYFSDCANHLLFVGGNGYDGGSVRAGKRHHQF